MINIGIMGYGNLGRGVEHAISKIDDMNVFGVFTRREPKSVETVFSGTKVFHVNDAIKYKDKIDVMVLCGGSATDLPEQGPMFLEHFNTVDTFDTHAKIPQYLEKMQKAAIINNKCGVVSVGWDPGLFSMVRAMFSSFLPTSDIFTFWGKGISQGHSDAIRRIDGVVDAKQYTIPKPTALSAVKEGKGQLLTTRDKHLRECYVVAGVNADTDKINKEICSMPNYFADYDTVVHFITLEELRKNHSAMPHGGTVICNGNTVENKAVQLLELSINLESNPGFTSSIIVAYARAVYKLNSEGMFGAKTVFDIPISYLTNKNIIEML